MKILHIPLLLGLALGFNAEWAYAQKPGDAAAAPPLTRAQVKQEREEFVKTHRYDTATENWVLRKEFEPPVGVKTRAQVKAERDEFIKTHRYDTTSETWVPLKGEPKSTMTRAEVRAEAAQFMRTHSWDDINSVWTENPVSKKKPRK